MAEQNGTGPQIKRREAWVELEEDYEGFRFKVWVNAPVKKWVELERDKKWSQVMELILEHNGWLDYDGQPYPPANELAFWESLPTDLCGAMIARARIESQKLPNYLAPKKKRR